MAWNRVQQVTLAMVPKFSSVLSLFGSSWIIIEVMTGTHNRNEPNRSHPYHRLLLAMSIYDVLESVWNFASSWAIPKGTQGVYHAIGTTQTCSAQGFFLTLGIAVPIYNAFLSLYYLLVVNYRMTDQMLKEKVEPVMHVVAFVWAFGTALTSVFMGLINNATLWCWIAPYPSGCLDSWRHGDEGNCERGDNAWIYRWAFYFAPLWFCILFGVVCTALVCAYVTRLDRRTLSFRRPESSRSLSLRHAGSGAFGINRPVRITSERSDASGEISTAAEAISNDTEDEKPSQNFIQRWIHRRRAFASDNPRTAQVQAQAFFYMLVFLVTHVWSTSNRIIQQLQNGETYFVLIAIHSFFDPLQGFLNYIVYQRPRYLRIRKDAPEIGRFVASLETLRFTCLPRRKTTSRRTDSTGLSESHRLSDNVVSTSGDPKRAPQISSRLEPIDESVAVEGEILDDNDPDHQKPIQHPTDWLAN